MFKNYFLFTNSVGYNCSFELDTLMMLFNNYVEECFLLF